MKVIELIKLLQDAVDCKNIAPDQEICYRTNKEGIRPIDYCVKSNDEKQILLAEEWY
jgi:hypothetical protein